MTDRKRAGRALQALLPWVAVSVGCASAATIYLVVVASGVDLR